MNRDQEKAMFASQGRTGPGIRKKQIDNQKPKLRFKSNDIRNKENLPEKHGTMFWKNNKAYKVDINPLYVSVDEMFQDGNHKWHQGKTVYFAQGDEQIRELEKGAGGLYVNTIIDYLDSAGALEKPDRDRKEQSLSDLKWSNFTSYARTYDSLNKFSREKLILDAGIPMKNYEPFTIQDAKEYSEKTFYNLPELTQKRIKQLLFKVMDAQLHNEAFAN